MKKIAKDNLFFIAFCGIMFFYYLYRMFYITPWYDELYTYLNFIEKGAVYSATHWPAPNNHVFFSVLSSPFRFLGVYIGLRGVSYFAALGTLILLYIFLKDIFGKNISVVGCMAYVILLLPNFLAVQGRGYSLATFLLMLSIYCGYRICFRNAGKMEYLFWIVSLWLGLYTLVSSVYWVMAVCVCSGIMILLMKRYKDFLKLILASVIAAGLTLASYGILWLNIGAQLISSDASTGYLHADTLFLIGEFPRTCLMRGMKFMLNDPNIQGIERSAFLHDFKYFARGILGDFFGNASLVTWYLLVAVVILFVVLWVWFVIRYKRQKRGLEYENYLFSLALSGIGFVVIFLTLLIQSAYPFSRVFSFMGVFFAILLCTILGGMAKLLKRFSWYEKIEKGAAYVTPVLLVFCIFQLTNDTHNIQYNLNDYWAEDAVTNIEWGDVDDYFATDIFAKQQIQYQCNSRYNMSLVFEEETPDIIVVKKGDVNGVWPYITTQEQLDKYDIESCILLYENELYCIYRK